jgi:GT2 family glycosyltransferase
VVHPETIGRIVAHLEQEPTAAALFGAYDEHAPVPSATSRYKNLLHHYVHQTSQREASTFWAGCGAVRRGVFDAVAGFDETYRRPSVEDIELGVRLRKAGYRILLCPDVQVAHLKSWTLYSLLRTDIFHRAIPWSRLMMREGKVLNDLNVGMQHRLSAVAAVCLIVALLISRWAPLSALAIGLMAAAGFVALNLGLLCLFLRRGGVRFALTAVALHFIYYLYSSAAFIFVVVQHKLSPFVFKPGHADRHFRRGKQPTPSNRA